jgi:hypothetical protein
VVVRDVVMVVTVNLGRMGMLIRGVVDDVLGDPGMVHADPPC